MPIRIDGTIEAQTKNIFHRLEGWFYHKLPEQGFVLFQRSLEPIVRDLLGRRVDLVVIVTVDLMVENTLGVVDVGDVFAHTGSNESILEPPIGTFNFLCELTVP